jgi:hypothetical protein
VIAVVWSGSKGACVTSSRDKARKAETKIEGESSMVSVEPPECTPFIECANSLQDKAPAARGY